ncbi:MAG: FAD-dependent oxidoreductase [Paracoccaceae bacterium]
MPFEELQTGRLRIAVIGGGISGMGAAHTLAPDHQVTLFESEARLGGHARTIVTGKNDDQPVDTGFIVFNYANYPHLTALFDELNVPVTKSNMSFGASLNGGAFEYGLASLDAIFAQRRNAFELKFLRMIRDILRFNKNALAIANQDTTRSIAQFLDALGTGDWFRDRYLLPLSGAIWSTPTDKIMEFPAISMMQFFENHALLHHTGQHQWYTVQGGSIQYVKRLQSAMVQNGVDIRLKSPVQSVTRDVDGVRIKAFGVESEEFDTVVFATHSDDTLKMLADPSQQEQKVLGAVAYQTNDIVLHSDTSIMPKRRQVWSSWVYTEDDAHRSDRIDLTYWMNCLQPLPENEDFFVTLNTKRAIREDLIYDQVALRHPVYDLGALAAQDEARTMNGQQNTWFCGAWMRHGFHEDGLSSGIEAARMINRTAGMRIAAE